ncbi:lipocalin family protein [Arenibacter sp. GZD96]|uniref:lipocalin family protein n=1 Tax=Aurantibrevibacter litoralis TaxID=3106030 RepID=UPI002AFF3402|nr:lipocalin family protein [Arenibacter sp. GZD-96]MEA1785412.1 lipocalin family protein [Arenibacter sp. GZD-96]
MHLKKNFLFLGISFLLVTSCSISKGARVDRNVLDGNWVLSQISYEGNQGKFKSVIFNDAEDTCFEGSNWFFRHNNSTGTYSLNNSCGATTRYIRWSVVERPGTNNQLQFKFTDDKFRDISGGLGYRLDITSLGEQNMTLKSNVSVDGEPITLVYQFYKN